ncbi:hypothetical protein ElyMa_001463600 [Elysia marginata]|uniref:Uncharacterized protein n=1 Tax=Elysia marginata TaxID=1093978 RepID=A0AAV4J0X4_9GAST|nr:hypothetical protein ElyMa_001463600 [Elysia marginata]
MAIGMEIKTMHIGRNTKTLTITVGNAVLEQVSKYSYLGHVITEDVATLKEVQIRIEKKAKVLGEHRAATKEQNNGWKLSERGRLEINWCDGDTFPNEIVDILSKEDAVQDSDDDQDSVASDDIEWLSESEEDITDSDTD